MAPSYEGTVWVLTSHYWPHVSTGVLLDPLMRGLCLGGGHGSQHAVVIQAGATTQQL